MAVTTAPPVNLDLYIPPPRKRRGYWKRYAQRLEVEVMTLRAKLQKIEGRKLLDPRAG